MDIISLVNLRFRLFPTFHPIDIKDYCLLGGKVRLSTRTCIPFFIGDKKIPMMIPTSMALTVIIFCCLFILHPPVFSLLLFSLTDFFSFYYCLMISNPTSTNALQFIRLAKQNNGDRQARYACLSPLYSSFKCCVLSSDYIRIHSLLEDIIFISHSNS